MCYKKRVFLTRGGEGTSGGRVPPALGRPRAHGVGQGQRCEVLRRGEIVVPPGSRWPQLRTNSSPISPGLPSGSAAGPRTHGSAVEAPRTRVPVLHPCCRRQSKRKKKNEKRLHRAENRYVSTKAACCRGSLCSLPGRSASGRRHRGEPRAPMAMAQRCPRALCEGRRHPPGRALTETTGELIKRARTHAELKKYFTRKKQIKHIFVFF